MSYWAIVRSNTYDIDPDDEENVQSDPVLCGLYSSKTLAVGEILKLYIEDNQDLDEDQDNKDQNNKDQDNKDQDNKDQDNKDNNNQNNEGDEDQEGYQNNNTEINTDELSVHRERLLTDEIYNTYTHIGNKYTLLECILDAKHDFSADVMKVFNKITK